MGVTARADAYQRRHPATAFPLGVAYKFVEDRGAHLAALLTYYGFVSLFPLLLLLTSVLAFVLQGHPELQRQILAHSLIGLPGASLDDRLEANVSPLQGSRSAVVVGALGTLYGGLGVMQAAQAALNRIYAVPRFAQPNPLRSRLRGAALLAGLGIAALVATGLSVVITRVGDLGGGHLQLEKVAASLATFAVDTGIFLVLFHVLVAHRPALRDVALGAVLAAALWAVLQAVGTDLATAYVHHDDVYGVFGFVLGLLAWIYLQALVVVAAAEVNVVRQRRLYPRALLTPFTDDVDLTPQDVRAYTGYARAERYKGFETVEASFERRPRDQHGTSVGGDAREERTGADGGASTALDAEPFPGDVGRPVRRLPRRGR